MLPLLGLQANSPRLIELLKTYDLDEHVRIKRGENDVYLNNYKKGISLLFKLEKYVREKYGLDLPSDAPVLMGIFLYGQGHNEFLENLDELPKGLKFIDGQQTAIEKLGKSDEYDEEFNSEFWSFPPNFRFFVDYSDDRNSIVLIQLGILFT